MVAVFANEKKTPVSSPRSSASVTQLDLFHVSIDSVHAFSVASSLGTIKDEAVVMM